MGSALVAEVIRAALPALLTLHPERAEVRELLSGGVAPHTALELYPLPLSELGPALRRYITKDPETWRVALMASDLRNVLFQVSLDVTGPNHLRWRRVREILTQHVPLGNLTDTGEALVMSGQLLWLALHRGDFPELAERDGQLVRMLNRLTEAFPQRTRVAASEATPA